MNMLSSVSIWQKAFLCFHGKDKNSGKKLPTLSGPIPGLNNNRIQNMWINNLWQ